MNINIKLSLATGLLSASMLVFAPASASAENMNPELLAGGCVVCHGPGGVSQGHIPSIDALSAKDMGDRLRAFRDGKRAATIMDKIAKGYTDAQIDVISSHFGAK